MRKLIDLNVNGDEVKNITRVLIDSLISHSTLPERQEKMKMLVNTSELSVKLIKSYDSSRHVVENDRAKRLIELFKASKTFHESPNDNTGEYNEGYVKAMNGVITRLKVVF